MAALCASGLQLGFSGDEKRQEKSQKSQDSGSYTHDDLSVTEGDRPVARSYECGVR